MKTGDLDHLRILNPDAVVDELEGTGTRKSKYNNVKVVLDGITFDSIAESEYYLWLKSQVEQGEIPGFEVQRRFVIVDGFRYQGKKQSAVHYTADFVYLRDDTLIVVDVKGFKTPVYQIKRKLFISRYCHPGSHLRLPVEFQEIRQS